MAVAPIMSRTVGIMDMTPPLVRRLSNSWLPVLETNPSDAILAIVGGPSRSARTQQSRLTLPGTSPEPYRRDLLY
jgi:hypothetical protein